jgi:hypothetical protein
LHSSISFFNNTRNMNRYLSTLLLACLVATTSAADGIEKIERRLAVQVERNLQYNNEPYNRGNAPYQPPPPPPYGYYAPPGKGGGMMGAGDKKGMKGK